jgi:DNA-binding CsgD family transcriptional regulator
MESNNEGVIPNPGRSDKERALERSVKIWELRCQGYSKRHIARLLEIDVRTVWRHIRKAEERLTAQVDALRARSLARQLAQVEEQINEARIAWEKSGKPSRKVKQKRLGDADAQIEETITEETVREGDPRYLAQIVSLLVHEAKLLGLIKEIKIDGAFDLESFKAGLRDDPGLDRGKPDPPVPG